MPNQLNRRQLLKAAAGAGVSVVLPLRAFGAEDAICSTIEAFPVPAGSRPHDVAPAAEGMGVWFTAQGTGQLGLLQPLTGEVELIDLGDGSAPHGVIVGPDGAPWITDGGRGEIQRVDAATNEITRFPTRLSGASLNTAAFDAKGALWFTGQSGYLGRLEPETGEMVTIDAPRGRGPYGICATPKGEIWFVSIAASYLGKPKFKNGTIEVIEFDPPTPNAGTRRVWSDSKGTLWIAEWNVGQVARYDPSQKQWTEWRLPGDAPQAYAVYVDEWDIVWLTDFGSNAIVRFDPATESFDPISLPHPSGNVRQLLRRHGQVWGRNPARTTLWSSAPSAPVPEKTPGFNLALRLQSLSEAPIVELPHRMDPSKNCYVISGKCPRVAPPSRSNLAHRRSR